MGMGEAMNWDKKALLEAWDLADSEFYSREPEQLFTYGAQWQREQLRTPEAVERLALFLLDDEGYDTSNGWPSNEQLGGGPTGDRDTELKDAWMDHTRAAITALLGDSDNE